MDNIVAIILILLLAVIGIVGQTNRRKTASQQPKTDKSPQNIWDLLESQMAPEPRMEEPEPEFDQEDDMVDVVPETPVYEFDAKNEGKGKVKEDAVSKISVQENQKTRKEKFPLRKAVIYSEILKRKYT